MHGVYRVIKIIQARLSHRAIENEAAVVEMKKRPFRLRTEIVTGRQKSQVMLHGHLKITQLGMKYVSVSEFKEIMMCMLVLKIKRVLCLGKLQLEYLIPFKTQLYFKMAKHDTTCL